VCTVYVLRIYTQKEITVTQSIRHIFHRTGPNMLHKLTKINY